ncbi:hypothetical protein QWZ13_00950 [Reinekea marina]|uniref:hypothetical protein n=1 Tax=Reinekea marina TaxID=1310421 RepID=UPI0025B2908A|nr:hypothetical protein [Reinekea marina]MDN3647470.1 hypothetical protein [Reinekea marina]
MHAQRPAEVEHAAEAGLTCFMLRASGYGLRVRSKHLKQSRLRFASRAPTCVALVISFGGGFHWSGHLSHGWRSLAVQDARTATRGSGTLCRSGFNLFYAAGFGLRVRSKHLKQSRLRFASRAPTCVALVISFGGGFHWSGPLSHGWRSLAVQDARTATRGSGTRCRSGFNLFQAAGFGLRVGSKHLKQSRLRFASRAPTCVALETSFGGGFHWSGHLSHGWRSLAVQDARTATRGSGTRCRSGFNLFRAAGFK